MKLSAVFIAAALAFGQADAFWRMGCRGHGFVKRLDPIVNPDSISGHAHLIHGPDTFSANPDHGALLNSQCTTCEVLEDRSAYWEPQLYFEDFATKKFTPVSSDGLLVYYFLRSEKGSNDPTIKAFPPGFRMIAGSMLKRKRTEDPHGTSQAALAERAVGFVCTDAGGAGGATRGIVDFPTQDALSGKCNFVRADLSFPSCWDGVNLDSKDHKSHMAYPDGMDTGRCPDSHPVRLPSLLFETYWKTNAFIGKNGRFVFSHGDATGRGNHGDFMNAWRQDVLEAAVKTCTSDSGSVFDCPVLTIQKTEDSLACGLNKSEVGAMSLVSTENVTGSLDKLPGCNTVYGNEVDVAPRPVLCGIDGLPIGAPAPAPAPAPKPEPKPEPAPAPAPEPVDEKPRPAEANLDVGVAEVPVATTTTLAAVVEAPLPTPERKGKVKTIVVTSTTTVTCEPSARPVYPRAEHEHAHKKRNHVHHRRAWKA